MLSPQRPPTRLGSGCVLASVSSLHGSSSLHLHASTQMPSLHVSSPLATAPRYTPSEPPSLWVVPTHSLTPVETATGHFPDKLRERPKKHFQDSCLTRALLNRGIPSHTHRPRRVPHRAFLLGLRSHWPPTWRLCHSACVYRFPALPDTGQVHGFLPA